MSGLFSVGGLISGLDSNTIIKQLIQLDRAPISRFQERIGKLESQQSALKDFRSTLLSLRNRAQDFRFNTIFNAFKSSSSEETVLTSEISAANPLLGAFEIDVTQLASSTSAKSSGVLGGNIDPNVALNSSGITSTIEAGDITINGVTFTIDPAAQSLNDVLNAITASSAGVTATFNALTNEVTFENTTPGDTSLINFGASGDTGDSNLLDVLSVTQATQSTNGSGSTTVTSTRHLGALDATAILNTQTFAAGAVTAGSFSINGISISIDPTTDALQDVLTRINSSEAQVTASYDTSTDTIRVVSSTLGSRTVRFGAAGDTSNFLSSVKLDTALQTAGKDAQFTINGGPVQTRNTNAVSDAISGVTVNLRSIGTSTVTVSSDDDKIVEDVQSFVDEFNASINAISDLTGISGTLSGDSGLTSIDSFLWTNIFNDVSGALGDFKNFLAIGISTGDDFSSTATQNLQLDEDKFRDALRDDRTNVKQLFSNSTDTGIADAIFKYLDDITKVTGYLNARSKANGTIDQQIQGLNDQIARLEDRLTQRESRLRRQFTQLEQLSAGFQNQSAALSRLSFSSF